MMEVRWFWSGVICGAALVLIVVIVKGKVDGKEEKKDGFGPRS